MRSRKASSAIAERATPTMVVSGGSVSTVIFVTAELGLVLVPNTAFAVTLCAPSESGALGVRLQSPLASAVVVPTATPSTYTVTSAPGAALPVYVTVLLVVTVSLGGEVIVGAVSVPVLMVNALVFDGGLTLPAASAEMALTVCWPSVNGWFSGRLQKPPTSARVDAR